jgi:tRNA (cytidine/uridine-2'-O-)-methyltransferase
MMHVVLIEPEIPWNTGNIGRTCLAAGVRLHLVGRLGFHLDSPELKRAGLDYWGKVDWVHHVTWEDFLKTLQDLSQLYFLSTRGQRSLWDMKVQDHSYFIFGKETAGFPKYFYERYQDQLFKIPQYSDAIRSLNLSTSVGIVIYEALRQQNQNKIQ